jgi:hypothetical protein
MKKEIDKNKKSYSCSFNCLSFILFIFLFVALIWGLKTSWGTLVIDIFPPYIGIK